MSFPAVVQSVLDVHLPTEVFIFVILCWLFYTVVDSLNCPTGLPQTKLGVFLEQRVNDFLKRQANPESGEVFIRVVHVSDKVVEVKPGMKSRYNTLHPELELGLPTPALVCQIDQGVLGIQVEILRLVKPATFH